MSYAWRSAVGGGVKGNLCCSGGVLSSAFKLHDACEPRCVWMDTGFAMLAGSFGKETRGVCYAASRLKQFAVLFIRRPSLS